MDRSYSGSGPCNGRVVAEVMTLTVETVSFSVTPQSSGPRPKAPSKPIRLHCANTQRVLRYAGFRHNNHPNTIYVKVQNGSSILNFLPTVIISQKGGRRHSPGAIFMERCSKKYLLPIEER